MELQTSIKNNSKQNSSQIMLICLVSILTIILIGSIALHYLLTAERIKELSINEVCCKNEQSYADPNGKYYDYIELSNTSDAIVVLDGFGISDEATEPYKYRFSNVKILPHKSIVIFASKKGTSPDAIYTGFSLDVDAENTLYLSDASGKLVDKITIPILKQDVAYGRILDGSTKLDYLIPSPGIGNDTTGIYVNVAEPEFSLDAGFYQSGEVLSLTSSASDVTIYYTLDGSDPTATDTVYTSPITLKDTSPNDNVYRNYTNITPDYSYQAPDSPVDKAMVVKAIAYDKNGFKSDIVTKSYFVDFTQKDNYKEGVIVSLTTDPENLFSNTNGIYITGDAYDDWYENGQTGDAPSINYEQRGVESERPAYLEIFDNEHNPIVEQNIGIRIQGASTRKNAQKRFSLYSRKKYGTDTYFNYDFFGNGIKSHSLVLRNSFTDAFSQSFMEGEDVAIQRGIPAHVFVEGEYWGDYYLQEKYSDNYIEQYYGVDHDNVVMVKNHTLDEGTEEDFQSYMDMFTYIRDTDLTIPENYQKVCELLDVQSYIDFVCAQVYLCNMDWCNYKNIMFWKARTPDGSEYGDGRWRLMMYDCDALAWGTALADLCGAESAAAVDSFSADMPFADGSVLTNRIFASLIKNDDFKKQFTSTFERLAEENFSYDIASKKLQAWNIDNPFYDDFFKNRNKYIMTYLQQHFYE